MKKGACTCVWFTSKLPLDVAAQHIKEAGFEGIEPFWCMVEEYSQGDPAKFRSLVRQYDLEVPAVFIMFDTVENYKKMIDFITETDTTDTILLVTHPKEGRSPDIAMKEEVEKVHQVLDYVSDKGKKLTLHTHVGGFVVQEPEKIDRFFELLDDDRLMLSFDCAQVAGAGQKDLPAMIRKYKDRIYDVHFKDISRPGPWGDTMDGKKDFCDVGEGLIDWEGVVKTLKEIKFDGWVIADSDFADDPLAYAKKTSKKIDQLWGKY